MNQRSWGELAAVVVAVATIIGVGITVANALVGGVRDDIGVIRQDVTEFRREMTDFRQEFNSYQLDMEVRMTKIELLLNELIHGPDLESPERVAQTD